MIVYNYRDSAPENFFKIVLCVCARINFIRRVPEKSATHNSHMASELVNKLVPNAPPPPKKNEGG